MNTLIFVLELILLFGFMWLICFLGTGNDSKNLKSLSSYPKELQNIIKEDPRFKDSIKKTNPLVTFVSNLILFTIILFLLGIALRKTGDFLYNFVLTLIFGQAVNLFDLLVIDLLWWRNIKRIRFKGYEDKKLYQNPKEHILSFLRALIMFTIAALINGGLLMLF